MEKKQITLRQPEELNAKLKVIAERTGLDVKSVIINSIVNFIENLGFSLNIPR